MNFDKISVDMQELMKRCVNVFQISVAVSIVAGIGIYYVKPEMDRLEDLNRKYISTENQIKTINTNIKSSEEIINSSQYNLSSDFMTKEQFIEFIGSASKATGTDISRLSGGDSEVEKGISKINFAFEVKGSIVDIHKFMLKINSLNCRYILNDISLRKLEDFTWLDREDLDSFNLEWWDTELEKPVENLEDTITNLDMIFGSSEMSMYIDIDFVTSKELL